MATVCFLLRHYWLLKVTGVTVSFGFEYLTRFSFEDQINSSKFCDILSLFKTAGFHLQRYEKH